MGKTNSRLLINAIFTVEYVYTDKRVGPRLN
jgi:hypothetical protein